MPVPGTSLSILGLVALSLGWPATGRAETTLVRVPPSATSIRSEVSPERLASDLRTLTGHDPITDDDGELLARTRNIHHPDHARIGAWVERELAAVPGIGVRREEFDAAGETGLFNVVAELIGDDALDPILVGAHYDSIASATDGWDPLTDDAPGADDDASGVSALLEIARVLASQRGSYRRTVRFVAFTAEEYGLLGSTEHVERLQER